MMKKINEIKKSDYISDFLIKNKSITNELSIYIHIPFCESRCYYCDFCSSIYSSENSVIYFKELIKEINLYREFLIDKKITSIFIGGGSPSVVDSKYICEVLSFINSISNIEKNCEISIELNPNSIDEIKIKDYISSGINRFSMGVQSFNDNLLKTIGRVHNKSDIYRAISIFNKMNINNFNIDLMLGLPNQNINDIKDSVDNIKVINPSHISYYSLILEEGTKLYNIHKNNPYIFPDDDIDRDMYKYVVNELKALGYNQYEISNFAKLDYECKHNLNYWKLKNYIGFGLSAHSNINNIRYYNYSNFNDYYNALNNLNLPIADYEILTKVDRINEWMILGLRLNNGISIEESNNLFDIDLLKYYKNEIRSNRDKNLIKIIDDKIKLTDLGRDLSNIVEVDFIRI